MEDRSSVWITMLIAVGCVSCVALCVASEAVSNHGKRERLEMIMKQMSQGGCAPIQIELVRELAK